jgi:hypothetical protein
MDPTTLERLGVAYVRRRTFEGKLLATQVALELGRAMGPAEKKEARKPAKKAKVEWIPAEQMLQEMGLNINSP